MRKNRSARFIAWRFYFICSLLVLCLLGLVGRLFYLTTSDRAFLLTQGNNRVDRVLTIAAPRGMITDRHGIPLAISSPVAGIWIDPKNFQSTPEQLEKLIHLLGIPAAGVIQKINQKHHQFVYVDRQVLPAVADQIKALGIGGLYIDKQYRRFYPEGEITSQLLGTTDINDQGQSGMELVQNKLLMGSPGKQLVKINRLGQVIDVMQVVREEQPGQTLALSIDERLQYKAAEVLKGVYEEYKPKFASLVLINPKTGEVLAMVNEPSFNPNDKTSRDVQYNNNYAVTSQFEPGSLMKPFAAANALEQGEEPSSVVDTSPGYYELDGYKVEDEGQNYGPITLTTVLQKSSNVGISRITLSLPHPSYLYNVLRSFGFDEKTDSGFPGEAEGSLQNHDKWPDIDLADLTFGYGVSVTTLQLAKAYSAIANHGVLMPVSLLRLDPSSIPKGKQVLPAQDADELVTMLRSVMEPGGTGLPAQVPGYTVAGKTGTAYISVHGHYNKKDDVSSFAGMAPATNPQLVMVVVLYGVENKSHFGGLLAGPVFSKVMSYALNLRNIAPDNLSSEPPVK